MNANPFSGTGVALVTPFGPDKHVDFDALEKLVNFVIEGGVNYLVALGTTAETPTLSEQEKKDVLQAVIRTNQKRVPLVCGIGGNDTRAVLQQMDHYPMSDIDAILSVSPYYNKPTQRGIIAHYREIDKHTPRPVILYNVPGRTGSNMLPETTLTIANACENIIGIKEACGNLVQCMELVAARPAGFTLLSGDDNLALAQIACGFDGVISVAANGFPLAFCQMIQAALASDLPLARSLHYNLLHGIDLLFAEGNPAGIKCVLNELGLMANELRLPVVAVSEATQKRIQSFLQTYQTFPSVS